MGRLEKSIERATNRYPDMPLRAAMVCDFIETNLTYLNPQGNRVPFDLLEWHKVSIKNIYQNDNYVDPRIIQRVILSTARKQAKTEFAAALCIVHLCGPEAPKAGGEIVIAAGKKQEQAMICFNKAQGMIVGSPAFEGKYTLRQNRIIWKKGVCDNHIKTIPSSPSAAQGLHPSFFVVDELAEALTRDLWESLALAQTDIVIGGLGITISTRSNRPNNPFTLVHDEVMDLKRAGKGKQWFVNIWSADPASKNLYTMENVLAASPAAGITVPMEVLEEELEKAKISPTFRPEFKARRLNIHTSNLESLVDFQQWIDAGEEPPPKRDDVYERFAGEPVTVGLDLGHSRSMTALTIHFLRHRYVMAINFLAKKHIEHLSSIHRAPYAEWGEVGAVELIEDDTHGGMSYMPVAKAFVDILGRFNVLSFRYDPADSRRFFDCMRDLGYEKEMSPLCDIDDPFRQGALSYGEAITELSDALDNATLTHDNNPCTNFQVGNCEIEVKNRVTDTAIPIKDKSQTPNDAAVAILMAYASRGVQIEEGYSDFIDSFYGGST